MITVRYGIPQPGKIDGSPKFKKENTIVLRLEQFPLNILPSGGMSNIVSESEMFMIQTCVPTNHTWRDLETGKILSKAMNVTYSFIGRFPWEITMPGMFSCDLTRNGKDIGAVEFEVTK
jgi:hypothetical protein